MTDTIWYTRCPVPNAFGLAIRLGKIQQDLKKQGVSLKSVAESSNKSVKQAHFNQNIPYFVRHGGVIPPLVSISRGARIKIVGMSWVEQRELILVRSDSRFQTVHDLKGAKIGIPSRPFESIDFWRALAIKAFQSALALAELTESDVEWVDLPTQNAFIGDDSQKKDASSSLWNVLSKRQLFEREAHALIRGEVDAIFIHGSHAMDAKFFLGARTLIDLGDNKYGKHQIHSSKPFLFTVTEDLYYDRPDLVDLLLAYSLQASEWAKENPEQLSTILARELSITEELVELSYSKQLHKQFDIGFNSEQIELLNSQKNFLLENGFLERDFDVNDYIDQTRIKVAREILFNGRLA